MIEQDAAGPYKRFSVGVIVASTFLGVLAGVFPFGYGAIPGGIAGAIVGRIWVKLMWKRICRKPPPLLLVSGMIWGAAMGLLAVIMLLVTMVIIPLMIWRADVVVGVYGAVAPFALPVGTVSGLILGAICGGLLEAKFPWLAHRRREHASQFGR